MRILNLIIASENEPYYPGLMKQWARYMNRHPTIASWFIRYDPRLTTPYQFHENTLWIKGVEDGFHIYDKTAQALQICLSNPAYKDIEYVIRTNLSSFYVWERFLDFLGGAPTTRFIGARIITQRDNVPYPSGCGMILSRDVAELWAYNTNTPERSNLSDDWAFGYTLQRNNLEITPTYCYMIPDEETILHFKENVLHQLPKDCFHARVKAGTEEHRRTYEVSNYKFLVDHFYGDAKGI